MPAVHLPRLKIDAASVCEAAGDPAVFLHRLHGLFDVYSDRTYRPGKSGPPPSLLTHYNIPRPVLRQVQTELERVCQQSPELALPLADTLWKDGSLETRLLAARILEGIDPQPPEPILERLQRWAQPAEDSQLLDTLLASGKARLQTAHPDLWLQLLERWLDDTSHLVQRMGLRALLSLVNDLNYPNLPSVFRVLGPILKSAPADLTPELMEIIESLARRSPAETAFYLRQLLAGARYGSLPRLVRKCLPYFRGIHLAGLKEALSAG